MLRDTIITSVFRVARDYVITHGFGNDDVISSMTRGPCWNILALIDLNTLQIFIAILLQIAFPMSFLHRPLLIFKEIEC